MTVRSSEELRESHEFHFEDKSCAVFSTNGKNPTRKLPCLAFVADLARGYPMRELFSAIAQSSQRALAREDVISNKRDPQLSNFDATLDLGFDTAIYSADADPVHTPKEVHARPDRVAHGRAGAKVSGHEGQKLIAQIAALNRVLAKMDARDSSKPKNRQ
jgi:hypothetical protein